MGLLSLARQLTRSQRNTFIASFLGWTLDAFDFFLVVLVVPQLSHDFSRDIPDIAFAITLTLMLRPVGALIFGLLADRFGRRIPLMVDIAFYSVIELATAFSPNYTVFIILRALYGIGMGGEWGVGAALAMEALPARVRGFYSGLLQEGYATGYLVAAVVYGIIYHFAPQWGWHAMFVIGALPAFLVFYIRAHVPESEVWQTRQHQKIALGFGGFGQAIGRHGPLIAYAIVLMTAFNFMSHGTQDLYPTFLKAQRGFTTDTVAALTVIMNVGAIIGGTLFGHWSQSLGRKRAIIVAAALGVLVIPVWIFAPTAILLGFGGFAMQFAVQGAWGIIPAHLNELSPADIRGTFPGLTYQIGNLLSAGAAQIEANFAKRFPLPNGVDYGLALSIIALTVLVAVVIITAIGPERRGVDFAAESPVS